MLYSSIVLALNINNVTTEMVTVIFFLNKESIFLSAKQLLLQSGFKN